MRRHDPGIYYSALTHYGNLNNAFAVAGLDYEQQVLADWKDKVQPYLGRLADKAIAEAVGVGVHAIRKWRNELGIRPFNKSEALEDVDYTDDDVD